MNGTTSTVFRKDLFSFYVNVLPACIHTSFMQYPWMPEEGIRYNPEVAEGCRIYRVGAFPLCLFGVVGRVHDGAQHLGDI